MRKIVVKRVTRPFTPTQAIDEKARRNFDASSYGAKPLVASWGIVTERYSDQNAVDVEINGLTLPRVPVRSMEWVHTQEERYTTGSRDLPNIASKVLVIFPESIVDNAFVLCSGFDNLDTDQEEDFLVEGEETKNISINEAGWKKVFDKETGNYEIESYMEDSEDIQFKFLVDRENDLLRLDLGPFYVIIDKKNNLYNMYLQDDDEKEYSITLDTANKFFKILLDDYSFLIDKQNTKHEVSVEGNTFTMDNNGIKLLDKNDNLYESTSTSQKLQFGASGSVIENNNTEFKANGFKVLK